MNDTDILCHGVVCILGVQECLFILMPKPIDKACTIEYSNGGICTYWWTNDLKASKAEVGQ